MFKWDGSLDWAMLGLFAVGAIFQLAIYVTIVFTFLYSKRAGLNIGIATSIWSLNPFMTAVLDRFVYGSEIKRYHVVGMTSLVVCAILVSMSELFINSAPS